MKGGVTKKQKAVMDFIAKYIAANGYSPTYDEIAFAIGTSSRGNVARMINILQERGKIIKRYDSARSIMLVDDRALDGLDDATLAKAMMYLSRAENFSRDHLADVLDVTDIKFDKESAADFLRDHWRFNEAPEWLEFRERHWVQKAAKLKIAIRMIKEAEGR